MEKIVTPEITKKLKEKGFPVVEYIDVDILPPLK